MHKPLFYYEVVYMHETLLASNKAIHENSLKSVQFCFISIVKVIISRKNNQYLMLRVLLLVVYIFIVMSFDDIF